MGNKFLGKSKKALFTLACTALLTVLTSGSAFAGNDDINGADANITDTGTMTWTTANTGTLTQNTAKTTTTIANGVTGTLATDTYSYTGSGAMTLTATSTAASGLTITGTGAVSVNSLVLAGAFDATTTITSAAGGFDASTAGTNFSGAGRDLTIAGTGAVNLGAIAAAGGVGNVLTLSGTTATTLSGGSATNLSAVMADTASATLSGATNLLNLTVGGTNSIAANGSLTVATGGTGTTFTAASCALTITGAEAVDLGLVNVTTAGVNATITNNNTNAAGVDLGATDVDGGGTATSLELAGTGKFTTNGGALTITADGAADTTMTVSGSGDFVADGGVTLTAGAALGDATLALTGTGAVTLSAVTLDGGNTSSGYTVLQVNRGSGATGNAAITGTLTFSGKEDSDAVLDVDTDLSAATIAFDADSFGDIDVASGATLSVSGAVDIDDDSQLDIVNAGTVSFSGSVGVTGDDAAGGSDLAISGDSGTAVEFNVTLAAAGGAQGAAISLAGSSAYSVAGTTTVNANGAGAASLTYTGTGGFTGNALTVQSGSTGNATVTFNGSGTVSLTGLTTVNGTTGTGDSLVVLDGTSAYSLSGGVKLDGVTGQTGTLQVNRDAGASGTVALGAVSSIADNAAAGVLNIDTDASATTYTVGLAGAGAVDYGDLDIASGATFAVTGATTVYDADILDVNNSGTFTTDSLTVGIDDATTSDASATLDYLGTSTDATADTTIGTLTINGDDTAVGLVTIDNNSATDDTVHTVEITTVNLKSDVAVDDATLNVRDTGANDTTNVAITNLNVDGSAADQFGTISTTGLNGAVTVTTATISGDGAANGTLTANGDAANKLSFTTVNLDGAAAVNDAIFQGAGHATVTNLDVAATKFGTIDYNSTNTVIETVNANGAVSFDGTGANWTLAAGNTINVGAKGTFGVAAGNVDLVTNGGKLVLDLGTSATAVAGTYATITGAGSIDTTNGTGTATITEVYGKNGVAGQVYDVFDAQLDGSVANGDVLNTEDVTRIYTVSADSGANANRGVTVTTDTDGIVSQISSNGGSAQTSDALVKIVDNQSSMNDADNAYVTALTNLTGAQLTRATQQTMGQEATTGTAQSAVQGVLGSVGAVGNQMSSFRSGGLSAGMTSFGSGGATAALSDMADAETLADAYGSTSGEGYTAAAEGTYKKVQVWANGYGGFGEQGTDGEMIGYDFWNIGTMVGLDYAFTKELRIGGLFGYSYNDTTMNWNSGDSQDNVLRFGAYASYNWNNFFVDLTPTMGVHMIDSKRNIWNGSTAKGDRTGIDFNINGTIGYTFVLPAEITFTPSYSLGYTMFYDPDYTETGAGAANIAYDSFTSNSLVQDLGVKVGKLFCVSDSLSFLPEVWGGWEVEYLNTGGDRNTTNVGQNFQTTMNGMATHRGYWGGGMTALINDNISVYGRYDHKIWDKGYNVGFTAGVKVAF